MLLAALAQFAPGLPVERALQLLAWFAGVGLLAWAVPRRWPPPPIECSADELHIPRWNLSRRALRIPYERIFEVRERRGRDGLVLGVHGRLPLRYSTSSLAEADGPARIVACVRDRIARLPDGAERLHRIDERVRLSLAGDARPWASWWFVTVLFAAFVLQAGTGLAISDPVLLVQLGANAPLLVDRGEYFRLVSANLLHANVGHLYMNGLFLMLLGPRLEAVLGGLRTALVLLVSSVGGAWASSLSDATLVSVGASTAVFGVIAAFAYINVARRDELPADLRVPLWLGLLLGVVQLGSEFRLPNVDHLAHAGGLAFGWLSAAIAVGRDPLAQLREESRGVVRGALALVALVWAGALVQTVHWAARPDLQNALAFSEEILRRDAAASPVLSREGTRIAITPESSPAAVKTALASLERASGREPRNAAIWDAIALLRMRSRSREGAIMAQWHAATLEPSPTRLIRLALYERDRVAQDGPLLVGVGSRFRARVRFDYEGSGQASRIDLRFSRPPTQGIVAHLLVQREGALVGHLEIWLGPTEDRWLLLESEDLHAAGAPDLEFEIALLDARPRNLAPGSVQVRFWGMSPRGGGAAAETGAP